MSEYSPDVWRIVKLTNNGKVHYRVFAGWYGGYAGADSWKMNSGIVKVEDDGNYYRFYGESGSCYHCHKEAERANMYMMSVYNGFKAEETDEFQIELIDFEDLPEF